MNLLLWGAEMDTSLFPILEQIKGIGYDAVEVPIFDTDPDKWQAWRTVLDDLGLDRVAVTINGPGESLISADPKERKETIARNKRALDCGKVLGSSFLTGPFHSALGVFSGVAPSAQELEWAREGLWELSEHAQKLGIVLGLEYLNRFESYLATSTDELMSLADTVNHPACQLMFDTFHANIEEKSMGEALGRMKERLVHVQLSENDRGILGAGHNRIKEVLIALDQIGYEGMLSIEAFSTKLSAANIWRKMFDSETQLIQESYTYLKGLLAEMKEGVSLEGMNKI